MWKVALAVRALSDFWMAQKEYPIGLSIINTLGSSITNTCDQVDVHIGIFVNSALPRLEHSALASNNLPICFASARPQSRSDALPRPRYRLRPRGKCLTRAHCIVNKHQVESEVRIDVATTCSTLALRKFGDKHWNIVTWSDTPSKWIKNWRFSDAKRVRIEGCF